ncbi:2-amino-4-hydroxy-6-hydroxymethyldihydropteridine diphosphokinase [Microbacterium sp. bgisy207]|jgi:2-amino-4-hydroxy-6-hydroxymethyldihydropteridine diphosphokinase/dihydroneopterin aldolase/2-amino-4-hydroxy-6-hydroxymethyldihydropteridine diphosphokinase|uniref:2-amino-4-hydroxy-6- hydroxymethyldihydropteridine diphosphokinase n=1 Tax=Microbacterium sp. bgisy207 TaxID=3413800 RepID=UPI003EB8F389
MSRRLAEGTEGPPPAEAAPAAEAVIALGANLGDRHATLAAALADLERLPLVSAVRASEPMESVAVTVDGPDPDAPGYLNAVAIVTTRLAPTVLLSYLQAIEDRHGRVRRERWGDRTLDLDLIAYGDVVCDTPTLTLPHPRAASRDFVLTPWLSIDPDAHLVGAGRVAELRDRLRDTP